MIKQPLIILDLEDDNEPIYTDKIISLVISNTINSLYQSAELILHDPEGYYLGLLKGRLLGKISISLNEAVEEDNSKFRKDFVFRIAKIDVPLQTNSPNSVPKYSQLGGNVIITMYSEFYYSSTFLNKAYKGKISDIVKEVIKESGKVEIGTIKDSSDSERIRYRIHESEAHFIDTKLRPFCMVEDKASYIFINEYNQINIQSFLDMYNQEPEYSIVPSIGEADPNNDDKYISQTLKVKYNKTAVQLIASSITIGRDFEQGYFELKKNINILNIESYKTELQAKIYESPIPDNTHKLLIDKRIIEGTRGTSLRILSTERSIDDQNAMSANLTKSLDNLIHISVVIPLVIDTCYVGKSVELFFNSPYDQSVTHWASGKYVVSGCETGFDAQLPTGYFSRLLLIAPSANIPKDLNPGQLL